MACQPKLLMTTGASNKPAIDPPVFPPPKVETARLRSDSGTQVATIRSPAAGARPSPIPTRTRLAMNTCQHLKCSNVYNLRDSANCPPVWRHWQLKVPASLHRTRGSLQTEGHVSHLKAIHPWNVRNGQYPWQLPLGLRPKRVARKPPMICVAA